MVYIFTEIEKFSESMIEEFLKILPEERKIKAQRYRFFSDKRLCVLAYLLLLYSLNRKSVKLSYGEYGKPQIEGTNFNLSHCRTGIACIVSESECGIDVQDIGSARNVIEDVDIFTSAEKQKLELSNDKCEEFTRIWTRKEAYCKYLGCGIKSINFMKNCLDNTDKLVLRSERYSPDIWVSSCSGNHERFYIVSAEDLINKVVKELHILV